MSSRWVVMSSSQRDGDGGALRPIVGLIPAREQHWVGDGFFVSTIFSPQMIDPELISPFLLMDHAPARHFEPATKPRGVGEHPHRGFETVTFAYEGEVAHRDSHGGGGLIGPGDVQWMTAGSGVVHEEFHSQRLTEEGGLFEMVQLWVNLPARLKMTEPRYQALPGEAFPRLDFSGATGRLIAGELLDAKGPAKTHSSITVLDIDFEGEEAEASFELPPGTTTLLFIARGSVVVQGEERIGPGTLALLDRSQPGKVLLQGESGSRVLVLAGAPLGEPVAAWGPFVMTSRAELVQAVEDFQQGRMGKLPPKDGS